MKYLITRIQVLTSSNNNEYLRLDLGDEDDPFSKTLATTVFDERAINIYKTALASVNGNVSQLPDNLKYFSGAVWIVKDLPCPMNRRWGSLFTDSKGVTHQPDDLVCDRNGVPRLYTDFKVLCKKRFDAQFNTWEWVDGWDPVDRANAYINSFFIMPAKGEQNVIVEAPVANTVPQTAPQQQMQQQMQQPVNQGVAQPNTTQVVNPPY